MPALQNVILTDRAATPVAHTFIPQGHGENKDGGRLVKAGVTNLGDRTFIIDPRRTPGGRWKVDLRLSLPVVQEKIENGVSSYVNSRTSRATVTFDFAPDSTEQERKDLIGMIYSGLDASKTIVNDTLVKTEAVW